MIYDSRYIEKCAISRKLIHTVNLEFDVMVWNIISGAS